MNDHEHCGDPEPPIAVNMRLPADLWRAVDAFRFENRIGTKAAAVRRLLTAALAANERQVGMDRMDEDRV